MTRIDQAMVAWTELSTLLWRVFTVVNGTIIAFAV